jgi:hypothetical protein
MSETSLDSPHAGGRLVRDHCALSVPRGTKCPRFPKSLTTCRAAVLATLLSPGEFDTEGMFPPGAIGLQVVMRSLARKYRWPVARADYATESGWATTWTLAPEVVDAAMDARGLAWLDAFRAARA